jgi:hypothetical protein
VVLTLARTSSKVLQSYSTLAQKFEHGKFGTGVMDFCMRLVLFQRRTQSKQGIQLFGLSKLSFYGIGSMNMGKSVEIDYSAQVKKKVIPFLEKESSAVKSTWQA